MTSNPIAPAQHPATPAEHADAVSQLLAPIFDSLADDARSELIALSRGAASGRVLAADVRSPITVPPFRNSQMDGYAVRAADLESAAADAPATLRIGTTSAAGDAVHEHVPGTAAPVMTGAPIPSGADAVVPIEIADPPRFIGIGTETGESSADTTVRFYAPVQAGAFVREAGADLAAGSTILPAGTRLGPAQLGSLASAGVTEVRVRARPVVLLLSTGHELRAPGDELEPGQIYDANTASLTAAMEDSGAIVQVAFAPDDASAVLHAIAQHPDADLIVTTGGVSAGAFEVVRDALEPAGVRFGKVAMQPGGPQGLGTARLHERAVPVIAFPGNPVSALLSFEMFLRPILRRSAGLDPCRRVQRAPLAEALSSPREKHQIRRGRLRADGSVEVGAPGSHLLHDYARATVLVHVPIGVDALPAGAEVEVWRIDE
ncbi:molybdopterin molybdotransferase MoeA [Microbacterium murale]|uniref:Molybdopterin molybdenumtransferase n=1 Tax=Microbacterium murale TaxID=1081040 RepID=A0ABQ1RG00_9MICO|nr:gephyrin-like molybdotransferase Glp [Microbacterium murale]GGD67196.1 putative molybdopterin biosynthesis protein MoeA [Microbacterium murale]